MLVPRDLKICYPPIASGASGAVSKAYYKVCKIEVLFSFPQHTVVAVKTLFESADIAEEVAHAFIKEVNILRYWNSFLQLTI